MPSCLLLGVAPRPPPTALRFILRRRSMASTSPNCAFQLRLNPLTGDSEWLVVDAAEGEGEAPLPTPAPSQNKHLLASTSYLDMLNDAARNRAYRRAIEATITDPAARVLDIGAGTGLLSMMAARALATVGGEGIGNVSACESYLPMGKLMRRVLRANGMENKVKIFHKRSDELKVGVELDSPADILVSEILDSELLGEGLIPTLQHAHDMLLVKNPKTVPYRATTYAQLVESTFLWKMHDLHNNETNAADGVCLTPDGMERIVSVKLQQHAMQCDALENEIRLLSEPFKVFEFDFWKRPDSHRETKIKIKATAVQLPGSSSSSSLPPPNESPAAAREGKMVKKSKKSKSKRVTLRQKHKVLRKVKEHHRKKRKEAKKEGRAGGRKKVEKDPGIPNEWPFKEQELKALEVRRAQALQELEAKKEARKERARKRKLGLLEDEDIANLASAASAQGTQFAEKDAAKENAPLAVAKSHDHSERSFYKELVKVIEASDVILEVLDARDPLGTRCIDMEKMIMKADPSKRIVLLLNKIDLVPKEALEKWLTYLREEMPTVAFKCNTQEQRTKLGWKSSKLDKTSNIPQSSDCLGAENLIKLLKNYSRSHELKLAITVGIVGLPNVGKSSLINSLKRSRVVNVGSTPGVTRSMQEVHLDKKVKLLDCPGVVMLKSSDSGVSVALRNCKRVEKMDDPISPVKEILSICPHEKLLSLYKVPSFSSVDDFLQKVATLRGKLKKGGIVDVEAAARIVLHDWNEGKIPYYTLPPKRDAVESDAVIISEAGKEFNVDEIYKAESSYIGGLKSIEDFHHIEILPNAPLEIDEEMMEDGKKPSEPVEQSHEESISDVNDREGSKATCASTQNDKLYTAEGILDPRKRKAEKKRRKANKFSVLNDMDEDYDFKVDYQMKDAPANDEYESNDLSAHDKDGNKSGDAPENNDPMTGVDDA